MIFQMEDILREFIADPQQALMTSLFEAITGTSVQDGAFPPSIPDPKIDFGGGSSLPLVTTIRVRKMLRLNHTSFAKMTLHVSG